MISDGQRGMHEVLCSEEAEKIGGCVLWALLIRYLVAIFDAIKHLATRETLAESVRRRWQRACTSLLASIWWSLYLITHFDASHFSRLNIVRKSTSVSSLLIRADKLYIRCINACLLDSDGQTMRVSLFLKKTCLYVTARRGGRELEAWSPLAMLGCHREAAAMELVD
jgi:hypothetical protein